MIMCECVQLRYTSWNVLYQRRSPKFQHFGPADTLVIKASLSLSIGQRYTVGTLEGYSILFVFVNLNAVVIYVHLYVLIFILFLRVSLHGICLSDYRLSD